MKKVFSFSKVKIVRIILLQFFVLLLCGCSFTTAKTKYSVVFYDDDNLVLFNYNSNEGNKLLVYPSPENNGREFIGWDIDGDNVVDELPETVTSDLTLRAVYEDTLVNSFTVTFYDEDGKTVLKTITVNGGDKLESFPTPASEEKVFIGWDIDGDNVVDELPEYVRSHLILRAVYADTSANSFTVTFYDDDRTTVLDTVTFKEGQKVVYSKEEPKKEETLVESYLFTGWSVDLSQISSTTDVYAVYESSPRLYEYSFTWDGVTVNNGTSQYEGTVDECAYSLESDKTYTYVFLGWDENGDNEPEKFPFTITKDTEFKALVEKTYIDYTCTFIIDGEETSEIKHYGDVITYPKVDIAIYTDKLLCFVGWDYNNDNIADEAKETIDANLTIRPIYSDTQLLIIYYGDTIYARYVEAGSEMGLDKLKPQAGYEVKWYLDEELTHELDFHIMPVGNVEIYPSFGQTNNVDTSTLECDLNTYEIYSVEELTVFCDALLLNNIESKVVHLNFEVDDLNSLLGTIVNNATVNLKYFIGAEYKADGTFTINIEYEFGNDTKSTSVNNQIASAQVLENSFTQTRANDFDDFYINSVSNKYEVSTSEQLYYVLERGYQPIIDPNNTQLINLYEKMKDVLRKIISDDMSDYEKSLAIYEWLVMNVSYDSYLLTQTKDNPELSLRAYSFYLEGVFNEGLAVCDGISKALVCLANMEGITCVRTTGVGLNSKVAHAWNKIFIDNRWFIIDATSGGIISDGKEVLSHKFFLIDEDEFSKNYVNDGKYFSDFEANNSYSYYENEVVPIDEKSQSLVCSSEEEAINIFKYYLSLNLKNSSFEFVLAYDYGENIGVAINNIISKSGIYCNVQCLTLDNIVIIVTSN